MKHKIKFWTGPCSVKEIADGMRKAGIQVDIEGTEHVYVTGDGACPDGARHNVKVDLERTLGHSYGLR